MAIKVIEKINKMCGICKHRNICNHKRFVACAYSFENNFDVIIFNSNKDKDIKELKHVKAITIPANNMMGVSVGGIQINRGIGTVMNEQIKKDISRLHQKGVRFK